MQEGFELGFELLHHQAWLDEQAWAAPHIIDGADFIATQSPAGVLEQIGHLPVDQRPDHRRLILPFAQMDEAFPDAFFGAPPEFDFLQIASRDL